MKYVSVDIETTGLDFKNHQIIEFGAVIDDFVTPLEELPTFTKVIYQFRVIGSPEAIVMNHRIFKLMANGDDCVFIEHLAEVFGNWLKKYTARVLPPAGKNYASFDERFLQKVPGWNHLPLHRRSLDPGSMYFDPQKDVVVPEMQDCLGRAGLKPTALHEALADALDVVRLIRVHHGVKI